MKRSQVRVYGHRRSVNAIKNRACVYAKSFNVSLFTVARYTLIFPQQIRLLFFRPPPDRPPSVPFAVNPLQPPLARLFISAILATQVGRMEKMLIFVANLTTAPAHSPSSFQALLPPHCFAHPCPAWWPYGITPPLYNGISNTLVLSTWMLRERMREREKRREKEKTHGYAVKGPKGRDIHTYIRARAHAGGGL